MTTAYTRPHGHGANAGGPLNPLSGSTTNLDSRRRDPSSATTYTAGGAATKSPTRRKESPVAPTTTATANVATATAAPAAERKSKKPAQEKPVNLPDPPASLVDNEGVQWTRGRLLGSGGFARVYDAISERGEMRAFKVIAKKHLQSRKTRQKVRRGVACARRVRGVWA